MFYKYDVRVLDVSEGEIVDGIYKEPVEVEMGALKVDMQPLNNELAYREYGYEGDVEYKMYSPINKYIKINNLIKFRDVLYRIVKVIEWDDYMISILELKDYKRGVKNERF